MLALSAGSCRCLALALERWWEEEVAVTLLVAAVARLQAHLGLVCGRTRCLHLPGNCRFNNHGEMAHLTFHRQCWICSLYFMWPCSSVVMKGQLGKLLLFDLCNRLNERALEQEGRLWG